MLVTDPMQLFPERTFVEPRVQPVFARGMAAEAISFAGPGKRDDELRAAILSGVTINLESEGEAARALRALQL